jgi:hypothetical protein
LILGHQRRITIKLELNTTSEIISEFSALKTSGPTLSKYRVIFRSPLYFDNEEKNDLIDVIANNSCLPSGLRLSFWSRLALSQNDLLVARSVLSSAHLPSGFQLDVGGNKQGLPEMEVLASVSAA